MKLIAGLLTLLLFLSITANAQKSVLTQHDDLNRTGWYDQETVLKKSNVTPNTFGKLFTRAVDDQIYAQPLVKLQINMPGKGVKNVVYVATVNNSVYAFDADSANEQAAFWQVSLTAPSARPVNKADMTGACGGFYNDFSGNMGIVGTPVIDTTTNTLYVVARSLKTSTNTYYQYLHALDITTGAEKANSPVLITATVNGNGDGSVGGKVTFDPQKQNQRPGLLLLNGIVYIAWSSHCDWGPYHGWVMGYDKTSLLQKYVYNTTPDGYWGGIWMSGGGPSADESGNIYLAAGNGSVGKNGNAADVTNRSESALKLTPSLTLSSFFTPKNYETLEGADLDFGVTQMLLIPNTNRAIVGVKDGKLYLLNRDNMGGYNGSADNVIQTINVGANAYQRSSMSYYKGTQNEFVYSWSENSLLRAFHYSRTTNMFNLDSTISSGLQGPTGNNGAVLAVSSNGSADSTAILWASYAANGDANQSVRPGILRAIDASDVTKELWNSNADADDVPGNYAKFNCPTIVNGKAYLATFSNQLVVYGLKNKPIKIDTCGTVNLALKRPATSSSNENAGLGPANAVDGSLATRWSSQYSDPQSLTVDLGKVTQLCRAVIHWEYALASSYRIQTSNDNVTWKNIAFIDGNTSYDNTIPLSGSARYVRMYGVQRGTPYGYSIWEFEIYGKKESGSCPAPTALTASAVTETGASLNWSPIVGIAGYLVQYKTVTAANWQQATTTTNSLQLNNLACNTPYLFHVQTICSVGDTSVNSTDGAFTTLVCDVNCDPLPTRWSTQDIGDVGIVGSACFNSTTGTFAITGSGADIGGTSDQFRFAYKTLIGDGDIITRVFDQDLVNTQNKAGIMVRESLAPGSKNVFIGLTSGTGAVFQGRLQTDGTTSISNSSSVVNAPYWLKLNIAGPSFKGFISPDGLTWTQVGSAINPGFGNGLPVYAGLASSSHDNDDLSLAHFDNYSLGGVLPFKLISFTGQLTLDNTVALQWITTLETNTKYFVVERTTNFMNYQVIDTVYAENNAEYTETYSTVDRHANKSMNYYRLRIVDRDGRTSYSPVVAIRFMNTKAPLMYPNPATGFVKIIQGTEPIRLVTIVDIMGRTVKRVANKTSDSQITIPTWAMANGLYFVEIRTAQSSFKTKLVVHN
ncbi:MAG TPA: discoidin domain-containing protein [Panacibacter sp.]|nr:discoidin domain-containing protein [Panacibacter sp.]HNP45365.1 discoidin domain-containing protein [Panacibacter sp.]